jgi:putative ABC transport system substrate-binding protein
MRRRDLLGFAGGIVVSWPFTATAQQSAQRRIALVGTADPVAGMTETGLENWRELFAELRKRGWVEGQNLAVERYSVEGHTERHPELAKEVVGRNPEVIVATPAAVGIYKQATSAIPIVGYMGLPVENGLVASLARPGGNITGITGSTGLEQIGKKLQLLKELIPSASRVAQFIFQEEETNPGRRYLRETAPQFGITLVDFPIKKATEPELRRAFDAMAQDRPDALYVAQRGELYGQRRLIAELVEKNRLPAIFGHNAFVQLGGLISYSDDVLENFRKIAGYVDRILKGAKPADLPIDQPAKFILAINLKTAAALGITVPQTLLARADEVIE